MDKRSILAVVLIFMLLYVYQTFFMPVPAPLPVPAAKEGGSPVTRTVASPAIPSPPATVASPAIPASPAKGELSLPGNTVVTEATMGSDRGSQPLNLQTVAVDHAVWSFDRNQGVMGWNLTSFRQDSKNDAPVEFFGQGEKSSGLRFWAGLPVAGGAYKRVDRTIVSTQGKVPLQLISKPENRFALEASSAVPFQLVIDKTFVTKGRIGRAYGSTGLVYVEKNEIKHQSLSDLVDKGFRINSDISWVGIEGKYFLMLFHTDGLQIDMKVSAKEIKDVGHRLQMSIAVLPQKRPKGDGKSAVMLEGYLGPKDSHKLEALAPELGKLIDFGMFSVVARPMLAIMYMFHDWFGNWGLSIILLTLLIKTLLFPLQMKFTESMYRMQGMKPKIESLKAKFKEDKTRLNQEMAAMYKQEGVNPLGGCLPMFLQLPIFIALYNVLYTAIELRQAPFFGWVTDLSQADMLFRISIGGFDLPFRLLPILMAVTSYLQTKLTPTSVDNEQQKMMMTWMPVIFTFLFYSLPSGLMLYWLTQNTITIGQNIYIKRRMIARGLLKVS